MKWILIAVVTLIAVVALAALVGFRFMARFVFGYDGTIASYMTALEKRLGADAAR